MSVLAVTLLLLAVMAWYLLAMIPAIREAILKTDARPLTVHADYTGEATHFARRSLEVISANFPGRMLRQRRNRIEGLLDNGDPYLLIPYSDEEVELERHDLIAHSINRVLMSYAPVRVPDDAAALSTIYAARDMTGGSGCVYRSLFADGDITLGEFSMVLRWAHAENTLIVGNDSSMYGRASAGRLVRLMPGCKFQRIAARRIEFGEPATLDIPTKGALTPAVVPHLPETMAPRDVVKGSVVIPPNSFVGHDVVSSGSIRIGTGSWIAGSLKAADDVLVNGSTRIEGSVVAQRDVFIGGQSVVRGPVIAERNVLIDGPAIVGSETQQTTIAAPSIFFSPGVVVHGTVWAREGGAVESSAVTQRSDLAVVA
jgi:cytoskeletal protein CcmA (bactofilin family)